MISNNAATEKFRVSDIVDTVKYRIKFAAENPDYFHPDGLVIFVGPQGSGKTLSAVNYVCKLMEMYPNCILVTNVNIFDYPVVTYEDFLKKNERIYQKVYARCRSMVGDSYATADEVTRLANEIMYELYLRDNCVFPFLDNDDLSRYENDKRGVIYFIDEIQLYLNSLKSNNVNMDTMTQLSQQRKQRKHIVATSQVFGRMAKPVREQFSSVVLCKSYLKCIQYNQLINRDSIEESKDDMHVSGTVDKKFIWTHSPKMYERYDTYYVIERGKFCAAEEQKGDLYRDDRVRLPDCS